MRPIGKERWWMRVLRIASAVLLLASVTLWIHNCFRYDTVTLRPQGKNIYYIFSSESGRFIIQHMDLSSMGALIPPLLPNGSSWFYMASNPNTDIGTQGAWKDSSYPEYVSPPLEFGGYHFFGVLYYGARVPGTFYIA